MVRMKISQIRPYMEGIDIEGEVISVSKPREVNTRYGPARVATAIIQDESGSIRLTLWRQQVGTIRAGDYIRITNAYAREFRGKLELSVSRRGKIEVIRRRKR
ncbi:MAG: DNA-binding protein [Thermoprotei archaeon]|nr:DNA-binding protein [Thermoprotei archaeon]